MFPGPSLRPGTDGGAGGRARESGSDHDFHGLHEDDWKTPRPDTGFTFRVEPAPDAGLYDWRDLTL